MSYKKLIRKTSFFFLILFLIGIIRSSLFEVFHIPSGSMIPNLLVGDIVTVDKLAYRLVLPFSHFLSSGPKTLSSFGEPKRGDIVVFLYPEDHSLYYIKRVIGLPGDRIKIANKKVFINSKQVFYIKERGQASPELSSKFDDYELTYYQSSLGDSFIVAFDHENYHKTDLEETRVPKGHYFVLGDNRDYSYDSRFWGMLPANLIVGKASRIFLSGRFFDSDDDTWAKIRFNRFGKEL